MGRAGCKILDDNFKITISEFWKVPLKQYYLGTSELQSNHLDWHFGQQTRKTLIKMFQNDLNVDCLTIG